MGLEDKENLQHRVHQLEASLHQAGEELRQLQAQNTLLRTLMENSLSGIYLVREGRYLFANPTYCEIVGYPWEELKTKDPLDVVLPQDRELARQRLVARLAGQEPPSEYELRLIRADGSIRHVWLRAFRVFHEGEPAVLGNLVDLTSLRHREMELRESEEKFRTAFMNAAVGITLVSPEGVYQEVNPAMASILGYSPQELLGKKVADYTHPEEIEKREGFLEDLLWGRISSGVQERRMVRKDGSVVWVRIWATVQRDSSGKPIHFISLVQDITAQRQAEDALRESEERYKNLVELLPEGVWVQRQGEILYVNPAMVRLLGASGPEELIGKSIYQFVHPDSRASVEQRTEEIMRDGITVPLREQSYIALDGSIVEVETSATAVPFGGQRAVVAVYRDIRERKRQEEERKKLEERFLQAQKMEAVGILAGGIAHDFNNLLMSIQGNASLLLLETSESDPYRERLMAIQDAVKSGAELTRQLLGFARGGRYEMRPMDMNQLLEGTSAMFGRTRKDIIIHKRFQPELWPVEADRSQMEQVLMNVFVNAADAMPQGGELFLDTQNVFLDQEYVKPFSGRPGPYVRVSITDTGKGMDEETLQHIFEPFFTTKAMGRGTGLGLATVYGIVKGHKGLITVYSKPGQGTTFHIYLPASQKEPSKELRLPAGVLKGKGTILLIDDEEMILKVATQLLEALGYKVLTAKGGQAGLRAYQELKEQVDLVLLDMIMPDMGGGEVFERLREMNPGVRVLLSSGYALNGQAMQIMEKGCRGFIQKPFSLAELSQKIHAALATE